VLMAGTRNQVELVVGRDSVRHVECLQRLPEREDLVADSDQHRGVVRMIAGIPRQGGEISRLPVEVIQEPLMVAVCHGRTVCERLPAGGKPVSALPVDGSLYPGSHAICPGAHSGRCRSAASTHSTRFTSAVCTWSCRSIACSSSTG